MSEVIQFWADQFIRYVPIVTWMGLATAGVCMLFAFGKRSRDAALLGCVCVAYGLTPYLPHM
jgi:hypothetical protein